VLTARDALLTASSQRDDQHPVRVPRRVDAVADGEDWNRVHRVREKFHSARLSAPYRLRRPGSAVHSEWYALCLVCDGPYELHHGREGGKDATAPLRSLTVVADRRLLVCPFPTETKLSRVLLVAPLYTTRQY
jgi:hypothetical protein